MRKHGKFELGKYLREKVEAADSCSTEKVIIYRGWLLGHQI